MVLVAVSVLVFGLLSLVPRETPWWEKFRQPDQEDQETDETARYHRHSTAYPSWAYYVRKPHVTPAMFCLPTRFELQVPPKEMNQQPILIPPITFSQKTEPFFQVLNIV